MHPVPASTLQSVSNTLADAYSLVGLARGRGAGIAPDLDPRFLDLQRSITELQTLLRSRIRELDETPAPQ